MKKILFLFLVFSINFAFGQNYFDKNTNDNKNKKIVVITNPTISNIKNIDFLVKNNFITDTSIIYVGVYSKFQKYNFEKSIKYISKNKFTHFFMHEVNDSIGINDLFKENSCSDDFYKIFKNSSGILFFGGPDLPPEIYGEKTSTLTVISDPYRHYFEVSFLFHLLGSSRNTDLKPFLEENKNYAIRGFCLGMQTMNVATGGTMYQDIPSEIYGLNFDEDILKLGKNKQHKNYNYSLSANSKIIYGNFHQIKILDKKLANKSFLKEQPYVISSHHQAVKIVGKDLKIIAESIDGKIIEGLCHKKYPNVIGVQFHPENRYIFDENKRYKFSLSDKKDFSGLEILKKNRSLEFHKEFWGNFSQSLK